jgi:antitoxin VapB
MTRVSSRTFRSGNSQAVRLPRDVAFGEDVELTIIRSGEVLTIYPAKPPISDLLKRLDSLPKPASVEVRDEEPLPERQGL